MKRTFLMAIVLLGCICAHADTPERVETLCAKVILENTHGYFILSDGSYWKAIGLVKRWRSLSEWLNNVALVPQDYECLPNDWVEGSSVQIYPKYGNMTINEADASNRELLKTCTHLFFNSHTGQVLFAISLLPAECLARLHKEARREGYDEGYKIGFLTR